MLSATPLPTEHLDLVPLQLAAADEMVSVLGDAALYEFTGGRPPDLETLRATYAAQVRGASPDGTETWLNWIVRLRATAEAIGYVQATVTGGGADIAWLIGVPWQGRGYGAEAATALVAWLEDRDVAEIRAHIHPRHEASSRVATRAGLRATEDLDADGERIWRKGPGPSPRSYP